MSLTLPADRTIYIAPHMLTKLKTNLLAVRDVIRKQGPVLFTADRAYILPQSLIHVLNLKDKIAESHNHQYMVHAKVAPKPRTTPAPHMWQTIIVQAKQSARTMPTHNITEPKLKRAKPHNHTKKSQEHKQAAPTHRPHHRHPCLHSNQRMTRTWSATPPAPRTPKHINFM